MASAFRILGEGQLSLTKFLLVTDRHVDVHDFRATLEHVLARTNTETDLYVFSNLSMDTLDYTGPAVNEGSKGVWLGLGEPVRELPREFSAAVPPGVDGRPRILCRVPRGRSGGLRGRARRGHAYAGARAFKDWPLVVDHRRRGACVRKLDEFPVDDVHAVRAGRRHSRCRTTDRPQSHRVSRS